MRGTLLCLLSVLLRGSCTLADVCCPSDQVGSPRSVAAHDPEDLCPRGQHQVHSHLGAEHCRRHYGDGGSSSPHARSKCLHVPLTAARTWGQERGGQLGPGSSVLSGACSALSLLQLRPWSTRGHSSRSPHGVCRCADNFPVGGRVPGAPFSIETVFFNVAL